MLSQNIEVPSFFLLYDIPLCRVLLYSLNNLGPLFKEVVCITHRHRQHCGDGRKEGGLGWLEVGKGRREIGTSVIVSTIQSNRRTVMQFSQCV